MKGLVGSLLFLFSLIVIIIAVTKDRSIWWWMVGSGGLYIGLDLIIEARMKEVMRKWDGYGDI